MIVYSCYGLIELVNTKREFENIIISKHNDILPHNSIKLQTASSCLHTQTALAHTAKLQWHTTGSQPLHIFCKIPNTFYRACMSLENTHKPIRIYMGGLKLGANTLFGFFKLFAAIGKGLTDS